MRTEYLGGVCDYRACSRPAEWDATYVMRESADEASWCAAHRFEMVPREAIEVHLMKRIPHG
jgi:hypothetical protein